MIVLSKVFAKEAQKKEVFDQIIHKNIFQHSKFLSDSNILPKVLEMIDTATNELLLISPWIYDEIITNSLIIAIKRGVTVKLITRKFKIRKDTMDHLITLQKLDSEGVQISFSDKIHAKLLIKDEEELLVSSKNFTNTSAIDMGISTKNEYDVRNARQEFYIYYNQKFYDENYIDFSTSEEFFLENFHTLSFIELYRKKLWEFFGEFKILNNNGNNLIIFKNNIIFCSYLIALKRLQSLKIEYDRFTLNQTCRIKIDGFWFLISQNFGFLKENLINKFKNFFPSNGLIYLLWPKIANRYIVVTDGKLAFLITSAEPNLISGFSSL